MMIDFALAAERKRGKEFTRRDFQACMLRFRPIIMTTMARFWAPCRWRWQRELVQKLRRPLGISIIGGLIMSQMLTLFTTPVVYLYLDSAFFMVATRAEENIE